ncbi:hypothetical protein JX266_012452 [Neoarthrinium moseri]|nr:hypothetical protein JX266_012452 [Neoarthrinium moseri]
MAGDGANNATTPGYASAGGFFPPPLPSPAPSTASTRAAAGLPHPRSKPLLPGSRKEDYAREYVGRRLLHISRRYVKKHGIPDPADLVAAYSSFDEVCADLDQVVDVLWFSGTPSLQVPYLLNIALAMTEYLPAFPASPRPTFALLSKLDHCFASLLSGKDVRTGDPLPGFERGLARGMTRTDMVRCKSLADETRMLVAVKMSGEADVDTAWFPDEYDQAPATGNPGKRKMADIDGEDEEDEEDTEQPESRGSTVSPKRQRTDSPTIMRAISPVIKQEDNFESPWATGSSPTENGAESANNNGGQFHWAVEDDEDDDSDEEVVDRDEDHVMHDAAELNQQLTPPPTGSEPSEVERPPNIDEALHRGEDDDDEEELHMSVAKVYEKTIVQLGRTLGETLIDD